jgi:hypothetical protein
MTSLVTRLETHIQILTPVGTRRDRQEELTSSVDIAGGQYPTLATQETGEIFGKIRQPCAGDHHSVGRRHRTLGGDRSLLLTLISCQFERLGRLRTGDGEEH